MEMKQIAEFLNDTNKEVLGEVDPVKEDLSNVADTGTAVFNSNSVDHYVKSLVDRKLTICTATVDIYNELVKKLY